MPDNIYDAIIGCAEDLKSDAEVNREAWLDYIVRYANEAKCKEADLRRRLKVAEDALEAASDAFVFCIEQCELGLGPRMVGKLCDDGKAVERALAAIRGEGGAK